MSHGSTFDDDWGCGPQPADAAVPNIGPGIPAFNATLKNPCVPLAVILEYDSGWMRQALPRGS